MISVSTKEAFHVLCSFLFLGLANLLDYLVLLSCLWIYIYISCTGLFESVVLIFVFD